jgi:putative ABC transport system substrate-binding protein
MEVKLDRELKDMDQAAEIFRESEKTMDGIVFLRSSGAEYLATANPKIPCFVGATNNPAELGAVRNLNAPEGRVTGVTYYIPYEKRFEVIMTLFPNVKRVGLLVALADPTGLIEQEATRRQCAHLGLKYEDVVAPDLKKLVEQTGKLADKVDLLIISNSRLVSDNITSLLPIANAKKLPMFSYATEPVRKGVVAGIAANDQKLGTMLAESVVDVLVKGQPTAKVPVKSDPEPIVSINQAMMQSLGLKFPEAILKKATIY